MRSPPRHEETKYKGQADNNTVTHKRLLTNSMNEIFTDPCNARNEVSVLKHFILRFIYYCDLRLRALTVIHKTRQSNRLPVFGNTLQINKRTGLKQITLSSENSYEQRKLRVYKSPDFYSTQRS